MIDKIPIFQIKASQIHYIYYVVVPRAGIHHIHIHIFESGFETYQMEIWQQSAETFRKQRKCRPVHHSILPNSA